MEYTNNFLNCKHLILSGGGMKGFTYLGLLRLIEKYNIKPQLETITGFSAGAIFSFILALGFSYDEIVPIMLNTNY